MYTLGPHTPKADIIGFDDNADRKHNLPIGPYATKVKDTNGREIIMYEKHAVGNESSDHTLLCSFQMREIGIIIDNISTRNVKNTSGENGTQSITFKDGTVVDLRCRSKLMSFDTALPTENEIANLPVYEIAMDNWNPMAYIDDPINMPLKSREKSDNNDVSSRLFHSNTQSPSITTMDIPRQNNNMYNCSEDFEQLPSNYNTYCPKQIETNAMKVSLQDDSDDISIFTFVEDYYDLDTILDVPNSTNINMNCSTIDQNYIEYKNSIEAVPDNHSVNSNCTQFFDCQENTKPFHLSIDYQILGEHVQGEQSRVMHIKQHKVNDFLEDMDWNQLIGKQETFSTLAFAVSASNKFQRLEALQPMLAWKPLEVIKRTLEVTTQWAKPVNHYPMKNHHSSRFPWHNISRLQEEVATDTYFSSIKGMDGSNCMQLYVGLLSRMINL